jgi:hypothetical protein
MPNALVLPTKGKGKLMPPLVEPKQNGVFVNYFSNRIGRNLPVVVRPLVAGSSSYVAECRGHRLTLGTTVNHQTVMDWAMDILRREDPLFYGS